MGSNRLLIAAASTFALSLALAACGGTAGSNGGAAQSASASSALIHTTSMKVGSKTETVLKNQKGLTLYYFTPDTATTIACTGACASLWPPLTTTGTPTSNPTLPGALTTVNGANGNQVVYNGHPLYTYSKDGDSGDAYGEGIGGKWFAVTPELAATAASPQPTSSYKPAY
ncbi:MAG: hypothetical protein ABI401_08745 [Candidatus Dormibacter sp.]